MEFHVPDMSCGHCKSAIEQAIAKAGGQVSVDLDSRRIRVAGLDAPTTISALKAVGFDAQPA